MSLTLRPSPSFPDSIFLGVFKFLPKVFLATPSLVTELEPSVSFFFYSIFETALFVTGKEFYPAKVEFLLCDGLLTLIVGIDNSSYFLPGY
jgi:hypothetical protein